MTLDISRLSPGERIAGASGIALLVVMFLPWYGAETAGLSVTGSAWEALSFIDVLLFLIALVAIAVPAAKAAEALPPEAPGPLLLLVAGALGVLLVLFRLIDLPTPDLGGFEDRIDFDRQIGVFLGLVATAGIAYGGWRANAERSGLATPSETSAEPPPTSP